MEETLMPVHQKHLPSGWGGGEEDEEEPSTVILFLQQIELEVHC